MSEPTNTTEALAAYKAEYEAMCTALEAFIAAWDAAGAIASVWRSQISGGQMGEVRPTAFASSYDAAMFRRDCTEAGLVAP
jgi:hypothetical protein